MTDESFVGFFGHVLVILLILFRGQVVASLSDLEVLLQLKNYFCHNNPIYKGPYAQWNESDASPCNWERITCNSERVTGVDLSSSNISGTLFSNFSLLTELTHLDLSANTINGALPADLNKCAKLQYLNLSSNILDGELNLTGLINLQTLDVTRNRFQGEIRSNFPAICANLVNLNLSVNNFTGEINGCFDQCPHLQSLDLSSNQFSGALWLGFSYLTEISVSENFFTGEILSDTFPVGCNLKSLDLASNSLSGQFPDSIANCSNLEVLNIWGNKFTGRIPPSIGLLSDLQLLILGNNSFDRNIPEELLKCSKLELLDLSRNNFGNQIQKILGNFTMIKYLVLHSNNYTGGIESSGILKLPKVARLDLSFNNFSGSLPKEIAAMPNLKLLVLANNKFSGSIPAEYGDISTLQALDLSFNQLNSSIPPTIGKLKSLLWLMLANNNLTGTIPPEIGNCSSLLWLNLANNQLSGSIPAEISLMGHNPYPTFDKNRKEIVRGTVGSGECLTMKRWLPATFPPFNFIYPLMTTKTCRTEWDRILKGYPIFPICLKSSSQVRTMALPGYLQLSDNQLSGRLPLNIDKLANVSLIHLSNNLLSGSLPASVTKLPLFALNISNNQFSGDIPSELGKVLCLQNLDLSVNNFSGLFPETFNTLSDLTKFNISYNPLLYGTIPSSGQISTFDNDSFLGDPLIKFASAIATENTTAHLPKLRQDSTQWRKVTFWITVALSAVFVTSGVLSFMLCLRVRNPVDAEPGNMKTWMSSFTLHETKVFSLDKTIFTYKDIVAATRNFAESAVIGRGGYGVVYHGVLPDGRQVAVKKMRSKGDGEDDGEREFRAEMDVLAGQIGSSSVHSNLVPLYGWCLFGSSKILVYEYMDGGSLDDAISNWGKFGWEKRLEAAIGVARALVFLHHECVPAVVHRDVKASNVLLDRWGRARVTDFGLSRMVGLGKSHVSTIVAGTVGYVAPEYAHTWQATTRGDVYSFGVLVMELATGQRALDDGEECLLDKVRRVVMGNGNAIRSLIKEETTLGGLVKMFELLMVGLKCTAEVPHSRPDMKEVLSMLIKIYNATNRHYGGGAYCDGGAPTFLYGTQKQCF